MLRLILAAALACCSVLVGAQQDSSQPTVAALAAARSALASGQGEAARRHAARVLWQFEPTPDEARAARLIVIDSYAQEQQGDLAFRAMLRFQQDHAPLDRALAGRFVEQLLALGLEKHAVNWLASLDDASPLKLLLRLRAGLAAADSVVAQARAEIARGGGAAFWRVVGEAAQRRRDPLLRIEALEHLLDAAGGDGRRAAAAALWEGYLTGAQELANQGHLLIGDDAGWADRAARRLASDTRHARAIYAYLVQRGRERATRENAQLQLVHALQQSRLDRAGVWLFDRSDVAVEELDPHARYLLGTMAERAGLPVPAARYWKGLSAPPGMSAEEWRSRLATVCARAGGC
jgi:hypothetical protein